jgi:uncharacterized protein YcbK (DUF882 family)
MDSAFIDALDILRARVGFPLVVSSGYRCPTHNQRVSSTGPDGPHTTGKAVDIAVDRQRAWHVLREAARMGFTGIGIKQTGGGRFIHLDMLDGQNRPMLWGY